MPLCTGRTARADAHTGPRAIKLYRELTNLDLKTAKDVIDSL